MPRKNTKRYCVVFGSFFEKAKWGDSLPGVKRVITKEKPGRKLVTIVDTKFVYDTSGGERVASRNNVIWFGNTTYAVINSNGKRIGKISAEEVEKCRR
jgi:hypothetical protein